MPQNAEKVVKTAVVSKLGVKEKWGSPYKEGKKNILGTGHHTLRNQKNLGCVRNNVDLSLIGKYQDIYWNQGVKFMCQLKGLNFI